jgi:hypothetical protein
MAGGHGSTHGGGSRRWGPGGVAAGRYGFAAVGTHRQVVALREAVMAADSCASCRDFTAVARQRLADDVSQVGLKVAA